MDKDNKIAKWENTPTPTAPSKYDLYESINDKTDPIENENIYETILRPTARRRVTEIQHDAQNRDRRRISHYRAYTPELTKPIAQDYQKPSPSLASIGQLLSMIPQFSGDPINLPTFTKILQAVVKQVGPENKMFSLGSLTNKLKGRAAD